MQPATGNSPDVQRRTLDEQPDGQAGAAADGHGQARGFLDRGRAGGADRSRRVPRQDRVHLARPRHARLDERRQVLRRPGRPRRRHARLRGRHRGGLQPPRLQAGRCRAGAVRRAALRHLQRQGRGQGRHDAGAVAALGRRPRHAGLDGLLRPARGGPAQGRRDGRGVGGLRRGRLGGRADRQDQGMPRGRHRRRARQVPLRHGGAGLRCLRRLQGRQPGGRPEGRRAQGHRRVFRERRRRDPRHRAACR